MPEEIAYLTPKDRTGTAVLIDFWNADLYDGVGDLQRLDSLDQILFKASEHTWLHNFDVDKGNGIVQGVFNVKEDDYYLMVVKLSSSNSLVNMYVDDIYQGTSFIDQTGDEVVSLVSLKKGMHSVTIKQWKSPIFGGSFSDMWFHSITVFQV